MKIKTQPRDDHQVTLIVEVEAVQMEGAKHRAARRISERKTIPGFRPGKAPYDVVVRSYGEKVITEEAVDLLLDEVYPEALKEAKVDPSGPGSLEKVDNLEAPKFIFTVPLMPSVDLGEYRSVRLPHEWQIPGDEKIDEAIEELRRMYSKTETVERPVQSGDFVMIDLKGVKTKAAEGEAPVIERPGFPVFVRTDEKADEWPYPGFSKEIIGMDVGGSKSFTFKYDKEYKDESLRGETIQFNVNVKMVRGAILPELNDEFAKTVGAFENLQALRDAVRANLTMQSKTEYDNDYFMRLVDKIREGATIKYPPQVLDREIEHVTEDMKKRLAEQSMDLDAYLKMREMDKEKFIAEEARPVAVRQLERALIMEEVTRLEKVEVSKETLNATFQQTWGEFRSSNDFGRIMRGKSKPPKRLIDAVAMESANRAITEQTLNRLKEIATGEAGKAPAEAKSASSPKGKKTTTKKTAGSKPAAKTPVTKKVSTPPSPKGKEKA